MKSDNYVVIQGWFCNELELKGNELLVFALIYGFSQDGESVFSGGRRYIADTFNISLPTVDKALQGLLNKNLIIKNSSNDHIHTDTYRVRGSKETLLRGSKETLPNKDNNIKNIDIKNNTNVLFAPQDGAEQEFLVQEEQVEKPKKLNLYQRCAKAINDFTEDEEVRSKLHEFLGIRLERKDTPLGFKAFESMLKKLRTLTESKAECLQIIQQSIDRQYLSFFPLSKRNYVKKTGKAVETMTLEGENIKVSDSEKDEMRRLVERGELEEY